MAISSTEKLGNWQDAIDKIWNDATLNGDLKIFSECTEAKDRINFVRKRKYLSSIPWLQRYLDSCRTIEPKSEIKAKQLRNAGNKVFQKKDFTKAAQLYTQSLLYAPSLPSTELAVSFGNRSAALFHQQQFKLCITDIDLALENGFPECKRAKLYQRKGICLLKLCQLAAARDEFQKALDCIKSEDPVDEGKIEEIQECIQATKANTIDNHPTVQEDDNLPALHHGASPSLPSASASLRMCVSTDQGRYLVTDESLTEGLTLIVEKPFAAVLLPDHYSTHCHHCFDKLHIVHPCRKCCRVQYCSKNCQQSSWSLYHQYECPYLNILHSIGIAHLSLRTVLVAGLSTIRETKERLSKPTPSHPTGVNDKGVYATGYSAVYNLMDHTHDMVTDDLFQYSLTAALLSQILIDSQFIQVRDKCDVSLEDEVQNLTMDSHLVTRNEFEFIGGILLRHIQQLVCNANAITELKVTSSSENSLVADNNQVRVATAIYPTASLMNHSCDPTIISSFHRDTLIVRTVKSVQAGEEIFNCYGPHYKRMSRQERQESLSSQYFFTCKCRPCQQGEYEDQIFQALCCVKCQGPVCREQVKLLCRNCRTEGSDVSEQIKQSQTLFIKALQILNSGNPKEALSKLEACYSLQRQTLYCHNRDLAQTEDCMARCYAMIGDVKNAVKHLELSLKTTRLLYGEKSVEVGHELSKLAGLLFNGQQVSKALTVIDQSLEILQMHYGETHSSVTELLDMKACLYSFSR